jgi:hypothetical protein
VSESSGASPGVTKTVPVICQQGRGHLHGMAGSLWVFLQGKGDIAIWVSGTNRRLNTLCLMPNDDYLLRDANGSKRI